MATGPTHGVLTVNPGGSGEAGLRYSANLARAKPDLFRTYDLVGFDPRSYGLSTNIECLATQAQDASRRSVTDLRVRNDATHRVEVAGARFFGAARSRTEFSQFVGT